MESCEDIHASGESSVEEMNTKKSAADGDKENQKPNFTRPKEEQSSHTGSKPDEEEHDIIIISTVLLPPNYPQAEKHQWHLKFIKPEEDEIVGGHILTSWTINIAQICC